jgi:hypothetical protein
MTITVDRIHGCFDVTRMENIVKHPPYKTKSLIQASDSTERHTLYGFWFHRNKNAEFLIVDKCIMRIQRFGGETTWET